MRVILGFLLVINSLVATGQDLRIAAIDFEGLTRTKESFLKSLMQTKEGDQLDSVVLSQDINQLIRLSSIAYASTTLTKTGDGLVNITVKVEENRTLIPSFNIWTQKDRVVFQVGMYEFNLGGKNATLGGFYQYNGKNAFGVFYRNPYLFSSKLGLAFSVQSWTSDEPLFFDQGAANFEYSNNSVELLGLYRFNSHHSLQLGLNVFKESYSYLEGAEVREELQELTLNKQLFKFVYNYVDITQYYFYKKGIENDYYLQAVTTENEHQDSFLIFWNDFKYYRRVADRGNWATRFRIGVSTNSDSPFAPFVLDNHVNIRGVGDRIERGTAALIMNTEYRHTLYDKNKYAIQGVGFVDAGSWRTGGGKLLEDFVSKDIIQLHAGLGLRFIHKKIYSAVLRIDYGHGIINENDSGGFVVGIGQYF